jgi:hypothetical protein
MWKYEGNEKMLEVFFVRGDVPTLSEFEHEMNVESHPGTGWRFPVMAVFEDRPPHGYLDVLDTRANRPGCPYVVRGDAPPPPPPGDDLKAMLDEAMGILAEVRQRV